MGVYTCADELRKGRLDSVSAEELVVDHGEETPGVRLN